jgi:hypothetical protein
MTMLALSNDQLDVSILDPIEDQIRLGSRYCVGGYVYEVADRRHGVITSGPGYPDEVYPPVFDGAGLPEAFTSRLWPGYDKVGLHTLPAVGTRMLVIGVGLVDAVPPDQMRVMPVHEFCRWTVTRSPNSVRMTTRQQLAGWAVELIRDVVLINRTLISATTLRNVGHETIQLRWFPHPFFPNTRGEFCKFNLPVSCPADSVGYVIQSNGWVTMKPSSTWDRVGNFQAMTFTPGERLVTFQRHPTLGLLTATCSYTPAYLPVWGNKYTFSFEPYLAETIERDRESTWSIGYDF